MRKKAQEEMVGFAVILVIVGIIILILFGFMLRKDPNKGLTQSSEISAFIGASLRYTSSCQNYLGFIEFQDLINDCYLEKTCSDGRTSCQALNSTIEELMNASWKISEDAPFKGYELEIKLNDQIFLKQEKGNKTTQIITNKERFMKSGQDYEVRVRVYG